jgi:fumarate reductase flavoprotein subunit
MKKETKSMIDRRTFIKSTAAGAGVIAATGGGFIGRGQGEAQAGEAPVKHSFKTPPAPIPAWEIQETFDADIIIIGAGICGVVAALSAAEAGAKTILIEKHTSFSARSGDNSAIGSRLQKKLGIEIDKEEVIRELERWGANKPDQRLIRLWADNSGRVMDWLMDMAEVSGLSVSIAQWPRTYFFTEFYKEYLTCHNFSGGNTALVGVLEANAKKLGVDIRYQTRAVQLIKSDQGRVTGVHASTKDGATVQFNAAKAVILCTGDYGSNPEMMEEYCTPSAAALAKTANLYGPPLNTGDGHMMGLWIGAAMEESPHAPMIHCFGAGPVDACPFLRVNAAGRRYENEDVPLGYACAQAMRQPGGRFWVVFDSKWGEEAPRMGGGLVKVISVTEGTRKSLDAAVARGSVLAADTIEELGQKMKVPVETFKATVARYTELAAYRKDIDFGKRADRLTTIEKPPFYAGWVPVWFLTVVGGLQVNPQLQVLDTAGEVIPGLYAAGNASGNFFSVDYPCMCPGLSHSRAWTFGRIAGLNAAKEA